MIIGIDASRANEKNRTGTEWYSYHVIQQLKTIIPAEHRVILYSKEPLRDGLEQLPPNWSSRVLQWRPGLLWTQLRLSIEMVLNRPDILYVPAHTIPFIHPKKVITVLHDIGFERANELYNDKQIGYQSSVSKTIINVLVRILTLGKYSAREQDYHRFSARLALRAASHIITVSQFSKKEMKEVYGVADDFVTVIPNGFNAREYTKTDILERKHIRSPYIFYVGRLEEKKNTLRLIEAFAILRKNYHFKGQLVLAGSPGYGYNHIQEAIHRNALEDAVIETGWVSDQDVATLLTQASCFVLPSLYEGFGIPVLEAMNAKTPVACSAIPALQEVCEDSALYFPPKNPAEIAKTINTVLSDTSVATVLVEKGSERIRFFSWKKTAEKTWTILQQFA